jgi:hypothetical protein
VVRIGVSITKTIPFRNSNQEFSNVYYYEGYPDYPTVAQAEGFIDDLATREKAIHSTLVTFVRGRLWKQVGTPAGNEMIAQKNLSGTGSGSPNTSWDRERAFLVRLRAGNDTRGNPVYLRKWYHTIGPMGGVDATAAILSQTSGFSQTQRDAIAGAANIFKTLGPIGNQGNLCSKSGRPFGTGNTFEAHQFLEHHQLGDQWRAQ